MEMLVSLARRVVPTTSLTQLHDEEVTPREIFSLLLQSIRLSIESYVEYKSRAELHFLIAVLLAIFLFVFVLPICDALIGNCAPSCAARQGEGIRSRYHHVETYGLDRRLFEGQEEDVEYWKGEVELNDSALTFSRSLSNFTFSRGGSVGSGSDHSYDSMMETIEESSEEDVDDEDDDKEVAHQEVNWESSSSSDSCPDLDETAEYYDDDVGEEEASSTMGKEGAKSGFCPLVLRAHTET